MRVLAFTKYGRTAASTRQRLLQYLPALREAGIEVDHRALLDEDYVTSLSTGGSFSKRRVMASYAQRFGDLRRASEYDLIWIYAELFPNLPAWFERLAFRSGTPVIYDLDDAFFHQYDENPRALVRLLLGGKLEPLIANATACCCGNDYLRDYAARLCPNCVVIPTVVDSEVYRPLDRRASERPLIGWIGSPSTWCNVQPLLPTLQAIAASAPVRIRVIGAGIKAEQDRFPGLEMVPWEEASEVEEVRAMDIGIMPLLDLPFQRGKSGYKLIQYMACGLPTVASPVGVNGQIVREGETGLLAREPEEWRSALMRLIADPELRSRMGAAGRARAEAEYSLAAQAPRLAELMLRTGRGGG